MCVCVCVCVGVTFKGVGSEISLAIHWGGVGNK